MFIQPLLYIYTPPDISSKTHLTHSVEMVLERVRKSGSLSTNEEQRAARLSVDCARLAASVGNHGDFDTAILAQEVVRNTLHIGCCYAVEHLLEIGIVVDAMAQMVVDDIVPVAIVAHILPVSLAQILPHLVHR